MNVPSYLSADMLAVLTLPISFLIYLLLVWDKHTRPEAASDDQVGVKTVSATLALIGIAMLAEGLHSTLAVLLTWGEIKATLKTSVPDLLVGAATSLFVWKVYLPRTNHKNHPKSMRLTAGAVAVVCGVVAVKSLDHFFASLIELEWKAYAGGTGMASSFLAIVIAGGLGAGGLKVLSDLSGVHTDDLTDGAMRMAQSAATAASGAASAAAQRVQQGIQDARSEPGAEQQYQQPAAAPGGYQQPQAPAPGGYQQPAPGGYQQPQAPAPGGFQQPQAPAPGGFQPSGPPAPGGFQGGPPKPGGYNR
jgi:hypothetical protein